MKLAVAFHLCFLLVTAAFAQTLAPISPPQPLSGVVMSGAEGFQGHPKIATNGEISMVAFDDDRGGDFSVSVARIDGNGNVLDPLGVRIADGLGELGAVVWNGTAFVVVLGRRFVFITPEMTITTKQVDDLEGYGFAAVTSGPNPRLLFIQSTQTSGAAAVVDGQGNLVNDISRRPPVWTVPPNWRADAWVAGASDSGFLVIREIDAISPASGQRMIAERLDRDGTSLSSTDSGLPTKFITRAEGIAGGNDSFLLVQQLTGAGDVAAYCLNMDGVFTGRKITLVPPVQGIGYYYGQNSTPVVRESNRYVVAWHMGATISPPTPDLTQKLDEMVAEIGLDGTVTISRMGQSPLTSSDGVALASNLGKRVVGSGLVRYKSPSLGDVFVRSLTPALVAGDPTLVTYSAPAQGSGEIAAGVNGYAATWAEGGPGDNATIFLRRFSPTGEPQDAPQALTSAAFNYDFNSLDPTAMPGAKIASNGEAYLAGWVTPQGFVIRRMAAQTGTWIDPQPVLLPKHTAPALASNGTDVLAVSIDACDSGSDRCLTVTRIPMSGSVAGLNPSLTLHVASNSVSPAIASNGMDYLVAWTNGPASCGDLCLLRQQIFAVRLKPDGTALDALPLSLDNGQDVSLTDVAVIWHGDRYLVAWRSYYVPIGRHVTAQGAILEPGNGGVALVWTAPQSISGFRAAALDQRVILFFRIGSEWESAIFPTNADAHAIAAGQRTPFLEQAYMRDRSFAIASRNGNLAVVYNRPGDVESGRGARLFLRLFAEPVPARHRAARR